MNSWEKTRAILSVVLGVTAMLPTSPLWAADWPCFRGANHNGISDERLQWPENGPKQMWKANVGVGHSAVSVVGTRAYTMGNTDDTDMVFCLDARTGAEIWKHSYACKARYFAPKPYDGPGATPTVDRGVVYTFSRMGHAFALDAQTGAVLWKRDLAQEEGAKRPRWGFSGSALVDGDRVIFNAISGGICLDRKTGATLWKTGGGEGGYATGVPLVREGKKCVALFGPQTLTVVDPADGSVVWETERPQPIGLNAADPVVDGTNGFVSAGRRCGGARYDVAGGAEPIWDNQNMNNHWQTCVLWQGCLYGCEGNNAAGQGRSPNSLRCLDWKTGKIKWEEASVGFFGLIAADGKLLMLTDPGVLIAAEASPAGYREIGRAQVIDAQCFAAPVLANGFVYVRNTKGDVVCLDLRP